MTFASSASSSTGASPKEGLIELRTRPSRDRLDKAAAGVDGRRRLIDAYVIVCHIHLKLGQYSVNHQVQTALEHRTGESADASQGSKTHCLVGCAWLCFSLSLLLILLSFLSSERAVVSMVGQLDEDVEEIPRGKLTDYLNWGAATAFVVGVVLLVIFAWVNI